MSQTQYVPVELGNIKRGKFLNDAEAAFQEIQDKVIAFVGEHEEQNASGELTLKVAVKYNANAKHYSLTSDVITKPPKEPAQVTTAFIGDDPVAEGRECLFCPVGGTVKENPRQAQIPDETGQPINK